MNHFQEIASLMTGRERRNPLGAVARTAAAVLLLASASPVPRLALAGGPVARNVVYVESNDPNGNAILAYQRHNDGSLTPLPGSPFPTGGTGVSLSYNLGPFDSDQEIITDPARSLLFAVNGGSDSIAVFRIGDDGALAPVFGSPFPSGGSNPVSLGLSGNVLCVVNKDEDPGHPGQDAPNYTTFRVSRTGQLSTSPLSTVVDELGSDPSQALVSPSGRLIFGADFLGGALRSFSLGLSGQLSVRAVDPLPPAVFEGTGKPALPLGLAAHPGEPVLYVGFVTINHIGVYRYNGAGSLNFLQAVPDSGSGVCWLRVNRDGTRLYASNTGDPSVSVYDLAKSTNPVEIQKVNLKTIPGSNAGGFQFTLDPTEQFLYVVTQRDTPTSTAAANALHVFRVGGDGTVSEVPSSPTVLPVSAQSRPQGVVAL